MTERILGERGPNRKRRLKWLIPGLLLAVALLVLATPAIATDPDAGTYKIVTDESGPNDVPGQKDLNLQGVDSSSLPSVIRVLWNWDEIGISGSNTLDACSLFDTDSPPNGKADVAVCTSAGGTPATYLSDTVYTCGDARVDRCSSPVTPKAVSSGTFCSVTSNSATDPFPGPGSKATGANYPYDTRGKCTIKLSDIDATTASLINTCSYPSTQPNSDPSDCVLIPRDAFLKIVKNAGGDTTTGFNFSVSGGATATPTVYGSTTSVDNSVTVPIKSASATTVTETLPSSDWSFVSASCSGGTNNGTSTTNGLSGITAASDATVTCTFTNALKAPGVLTIEKSCPNGANASTDTFQPKDGTANAGSAIACGHSTTYSPSPGVAYSITEAAAGTTDLNNYTSDLTDPDCSGTLARGATATCTIVNTLKGAGVLTIEKSCPGGAYAVGDTFQPKDGTANAGSAIACSASTTYTTTPGVAYAITEAAAGTTNLNNYTSDLTDPDCSGTLARGATATCTIVNTLRKFTVITLVCEGSQLYSSSVTFDGDVKSSLNHGDALPGTVTEANLCSLGGARYTGKKSGTYTGQVVISP